MSQIVSQRIKASPIVGRNGLRPDGIGEMARTFGDMSWAFRASQRPVFLP
jgi:hypothetical protein